MEKIKIPRPNDPLGAGIFDLLFGEEENAEVEILNMEKVREIKNGLAGMFLLTNKIDEMLKTMKESNTLLKEANERMEKLEEKLKL